MIKEKYLVKNINHKDCYPFLMEIHYARRIPSICHSFGLFDLDKNILVGVITFGIPPAPTEQVEWNDFNLLELNRLCLRKQLEKNVLSYFVSNSLKRLPNNSVIISYSDMDYNHSGYIYQSTNWIYTGIGSVGTKTFIMNDGRERHSRHLSLIDMNKVKSIRKATGKHRYFYFIGNRRQKRFFMKILLKRYKILDYPKQKNERYFIKNDIILQTSLGLWEPEIIFSEISSCHNSKQEKRLKENKKHKQKGIFDW
jgi:hypothetical protein